MPDDTVARIAASAAECGMRRLANWLPADRHADLRELLYDLTVSALHAFADVDGFRVPEPSTN